MAAAAQVTRKVPPEKPVSSPRHRPVSSSSTPASLGYRMPGEFEPHACTWLSWPGATTRSWADAGAITTEIAAVASAIRRFEPVRVAVDPEFHAEAIRLLGHDSEIVEIPADDIWTRDSGPTFLTGPDGTLAATTWNFNAWGNKFDHHEKDVLLAQRIASRIDVPSFTASIVAEGGGLHVDGEGTVVATESSILNSNRNPGVSREEVELALHGWLGTSKVIWIPGKAHDAITDGHIDGLMTFVRPGVALFELSDDSADPRARILKEQLRALQLATDARGRRIEVTVLKSPMEFPVDAPDFCGLYVNCLILNGAVLIPAFGDRKADAAAIDVFARAFPGRSIVPLRIDAIASGGGGIHCITQQQPMTCPLRDGKGELS